VVKVDNQKGPDSTKMKIERGLYRYGSFRTGIRDLYQLDSEKGRGEFTQSASQILETRVRKYGPRYRLRNRIKRHIRPQSITRGKGWTLVAKA